MDSWSLWDLVKRLFLWLVSLVPAALQQLLPEREFDRTDGNLTTSSASSSRTIKVVGKTNPGYDKTVNATGAICRKGRRYEGLQNNVEVTGTEAGTTDNVNAVGVVLE